MVLYTVLIGTSSTVGERFGRKDELLTWKPVADYTEHVSDQDLQHQQVRQRS